MISFNQSPSRRYALLINGHEYLVEELIDYCPECRGIWLDRGELDKIIERRWWFPVGQPVKTALVDTVTMNTINTVTSTVTTVNAVAGEAGFSDLFD